MSQSYTSSAAKRAPARATPTPFVGPREARHAGLPSWSAIPNFLLDLKQLYPAVRCALLEVWRQIYQKAAGRLWELSDRQLAAFAGVSRDVAQRVLAACVESGMIQEHPPQWGKRKRYGVNLPLDAAAVASSLLTLLPTKKLNETGEMDEVWPAQQATCGPPSRPQSKEESLETPQEKNLSRESTPPANPPPPVRRTAAGMSEKSPRERDLLAERATLRLSLRYDTKLDATLRDEFTRRVAEIEVALVDPL